MCSHAKRTIVLFALFASLSTSAFGAACKKLNAMQGNWDTSLSIPLTLDRTVLYSSNDLTDALDLQNFARLSLYGQFTFNNRSILTKGTFRDHQLDKANSDRIIEYQQAPQGVKLDKTTRSSETNKVLTRWRKANKRCDGTADFLLRGKNTVNNEYLINYAHCSVRYRLDKDAHNSHLYGTCEVRVYDPLIKQNKNTLGILSGTMIKKF